MFLLLIFIIILFLLFLLLIFKFLCEKRHVGVLEQSSFNKPNMYAADIKRGVTKC